MSTILPEEDYRALIEQAHLIDQLTKHPGWPVFVDWMHERMRPVKDGLLNGRAKSHDAYLEATGFCKGVHEVLDAPAKVKTLVLNQQQQRQELEEDVEVIRPDDWA